MSQYLYMFSEIVNNETRVEYVFVEAKNEYHAELLGRRRCAKPKTKKYAQHVVLVPVPLLLNEKGQS